MTTIIDRIVAHVSAPDVYDPPTAGQMLFVAMRCRELLKAAEEVAPALRQIATEVRIGPNGEGQDWRDTLFACADDLDFAGGNNEGMVK